MIAEGPVAAGGVWAIQRCGGRSGIGRRMTGRANRGVLVAACSPAELADTLLVAVTADGGVQSDHSLQRVGLIAVGWQSDYVDACEKVLWLQLLVQTPTSGVPSRRGFGGGQQCRQRRSRPWGWGIRAEMVRTRQGLVVEACGWWPRRRDRLTGIECRRGAGVIEDSRW